MENPIFICCPQLFHLIKIYIPRSMIVIPLGTGWKELSVVFHVHAESKSLIYKVDDYRDDFVFCAIIYHRKVHLTTVSSDNEFILSVCFSVRGGMSCLCCFDFRELRPPSRLELDSVTSP